MFDYTNYQIADIPIFMMTMIGITTGLLAYVTVKGGESSGEDSKPVSGGGNCLSKRAKHTKSSKTRRCK